MNGGTRALLRIAGREAWRAKARTALVALLVALPLAGAGAVDVVWRATVLEARDVVQLELAGAQARVEVVAGGPVTQTATGVAVYPETAFTEPLGPVTGQLAALAGAVPTGDRFIAAPSWSVELIRGRDHAEDATLWQLPYAGEPDLAGLVEQVRGRAPSATGEVALSVRLAERLGSDVGGEISVPGERPGLRRSMQVVGVVRVTPRFDGPDVVLGVDGLIPAAVLTAPGDPRIPGTGRPVAGGWVVGPIPLDRPRVDQLCRNGATAISRALILTDYTPEPGQAGAAAWASKYPDQAVIVAVTVGLVLLQIVLMAGPALAVGARRQQRTLALLGATGGTRRHLRGLVLANGLVAGIMAGLAGVALGTGLGVVAVGWARDHRDLLAPRLDVRLTDLLVLLATGVLTTVGAALVPARLAARMDVVGALAGRRPAARRQRTRTAAGLLLAVAGLAGALVAAARHEPAPTVVGIAATEIGFVLLVPAIVALAARLTGAAAPTLRISLRDADRQRTRTAPAVAAVMAAVAAAVASMTFAATQTDRTTAWAQSRQPPEVAVFTGESSLGEPAHPDPTDPARVVPPFEPERIAARLGAQLPVRSWGLVAEAGFTEGEPASITAVASPDSACPGSSQVAFDTPAMCQDFTAAHVVNLDWSALVMDGTALGALTGNEAAAREAGKALAAGAVVVARPSLLWPDGTVHLKVATYDGTDTKTMRTLRLPGYLWRGDPAPGDPAVAPATLAAHGLKTWTRTLVVRVAHPPTQGEQRDARRALVGADPRGSGLSWGDPGPPTPLLLWAILAAAVAVALIGTFSAVGLAAAEARPDLSTLAAIGASPGLRRRFAAAQAVTVAGLGSAVGLVAGLATGYVFARLLMHPMRSWGDVLVDTESARWGHTWGMHVPWLPVLVFALGLPLITAAVMAALTRSRLPVVRRLGQ